MKLWLVVLTAGKWEGKEIPISLPQFLIGRDPGCNLRPASPLISKRHCVLTTRGEQVFLGDFGSTNGTYLNEQPVQAEMELHDQDVVRVGPIAFRVRLKLSQVPVDMPTPLPPIRLPEHAADDDAAATLLLNMADSEPSAGAGGSQDPVPGGSTVMEAIAPQENSAATTETKSGGASRMEKAQTANADTSVAAKAILEKYLRRTRT
jgi:pSer/pThr/pTyr-binding forkhead associated (FHA) protein